ncbi:MAG: histidine decarboxylase [Candidatus Micrarchaeia archaeon]
MDKHAKEKLENEYLRLKSLEKTFIGYPCDAQFDYSHLYKFLKFPMNNVGDPFEKSTYRLQTKNFEIEVLDFFAKLLHIKKDKYWGYITNGGTEGNLYGLYAARESMPNARVFYSKHTHYSIRKNIHILRMSGCELQADSNGEMDYNNFEKTLCASDKKNGVIIIANIGTTMTGAIDNVDTIVRILKKHKIKYYIHADAALYGMVLPFCSDVKFDFQTGINSIAISGHKFLGSPIPCGIVLARKDVAICLRKYIEYIDAHDSTLSGSRDAFTPLILWYRIKTIGLSGFSKQVKHCNMLADYLTDELEKIGWPNVGKSYVTVRFSRPSDHLVSKWELAANKDMAHVVCMPHESKAQLAKFVQDMKKEIIRK